MQILFRNPDSYNQAFFQSLVPLPHTYRLPFQLCMEDHSSGSLPLGNIPAQIRSYPVPDAAIRSIHSKAIP